jgi:hypothetical protein
MAQDEVANLRARVAELEGMLDRPTADPPPPHGSPWRGVASAVLLVLACVLAPLSVVSVWAATQLSDTDQYVATVAPLATDPQVQQAVSDDVTAAVLDALNVDQVTTQLLGTLADQENMPPRLAALLPGLAVPLNQGIEGFTRDQVESLLATPQFATLWEQVNRTAHEQVVRLLEGDQGGAVTAQNDTVTLNLAPIVAEVKSRLVARGFTLAENIPAVDRQFVLVQSDAVTNAQSVYRLLTTLGVWLPIVTLALFIGGIALARDRRRALTRGAIGLTSAMLALGVVLALARSWYVSTTPADILTEQAAGDVFDTLVRFLRTGLRAVAVLGLVLALGAFLAGPSSVAVRTRATLQGGIGSARAGARTKGWDTGAFGAAMFAHRKGVRIGVLVAAGVVLAFWTRPSAWVVVAVAAGALVLLAVAEFLSAPPPSAAELVPARAPAAPASSADTSVPRQAQRAVELPPEEQRPQPTPGASGQRRRPE